MAARDDAEPQQLEMQFGSDAPVVGAMRLFLQSRCVEQLARLAAAAHASRQPQQQQQQQPVAHNLEGYNWADEKK
ncbi:hypothetical protein LPJ59_006638, partial [Coemansia sp. RSA 2399]